MKLILSLIEVIISGIIIWEVAIPLFLSLSRTDMGNWAYFGLFSFIILVIVIEYSSFKENKATWVVSKIFDSFVK